MSRPDAHYPEQLLRDELALTKEKLRMVGQAASDLEYRLMMERNRFFEGSVTQHLSRFFARLDLEKAIVTALHDSPHYTALLERIDAIQYELNERHMDAQDEVAA